MGLAHRTYSIKCAPAWEGLQVALATSMAVAVQVVPASDSLARVRAFRVGGSADVSFASGVLEWEAPLSANPYFLTHLHHALVGLGATPTSARASDLHPCVPWRELPLRRRIVDGAVGQVTFGVLWVALSPVMLLVVVAWGAFKAVRNALKRASGR